MTSAATPTAPSTEQPTWQPPARTPLRRSSTDSMLGGVCGGLAEYSRIDALLWRAGFIVLTFAGPGLLVYLVLWLLMPLGPTTPDHRPNALERTIGRLNARLTGRRAAAPYQTPQA